MATQAATSGALPGSSGVAVNAGAGPVAYMGFSVRETAGAAASFRLRDGTVTGNILESVGLAANQSTGDYYENGIIAETGQIYYEKITGTIEGCVRYA